MSATNRGAIQVIATDELCCPLRIKLQGSRIDDTTGGNSGVEPRVGLMYTQMVSERGYAPAHFVDIISTNAAKIMASTRARARLRWAPTPTSCCSRPASTRRSGRPTCTRPTTRPGRGTG